VLFIRGPKVTATRSGTEDYVFAFRKVKT